MVSLEGLGGFRGEDCRLHLITGDKKIDIEGLHLMAWGFSPVAPGAAFGDSCLDDPHVFLTGRLHRAGVPNRLGAGPARRLTDLPAHQFAIRE